MCRTATVITAVLFFTYINADSSEDTQGFTYYAPSTLNFHDIYANSLAMLTGDSASPSSLLKDDDSFHLSNMPSQFVEFHPQTQTIPTSTTIPPKYIHKSLKNDTEESTNSTVTTTTTTEEPEELTIKVIPIIKTKTIYQRGVLDLLFPATRVKNFKSVFDTVRRLLSHTF